MADSLNYAFAMIVKNGVVHRFTGTALVFEGLEQAEAHPGEKILAIPFRQALWGDRPTSEIEQTARQHVSAIQVEAYEGIPFHDFVARADSCGVELVNGHFDVSDSVYMEQVASVVENEIRAGHGSNFVLHRTYKGRIRQRDVKSELKAFHAVLRAESGAYWTFLVHLPDHTLIGATPEMHLRRSRDGMMTMNPISGTYRYPDGTPEEKSLREFLQDSKERDELYMVLDEELKVMAELCEGRPWISAPQLRFMSNLAHTEYLIHGHSELNWSAALRRSLIAPTILGSPLESAFRMAQRNDLSPRGYLGGVLAHVPAEPSGAFDSAILIRTACIEESGDVSIPVGATIVRDSIPAAETAETLAKASGVLGAFSLPRENTLVKLAQELLASREGEVASFWRQEGSSEPKGLVHTRLRALVIDNEDRFTGMLAAHLRSLGLEVEVTVGIPDESQLVIADLLVLGPGPGDPNDQFDPRIATARSFIQRIIPERQIPTLAVCLSHQLVCRELGLPVRRLPQPNQGRQREIDLFGEKIRVGFYNSYSAYAGAGAPADVEIAFDKYTGEVHAIRSDRLIGLQFHPESVLSIDGAQVLREAVESLLTRTQSSV